MFIYFSIENFKAFRDKQEVRFLADPNAVEDHPRLKRNVFELDAFPGAKFLKALAFFGANASGKSTVLEGLGLLTSLLQRPDNFAREQKLPYQPFLLNAPRSLSEPTAFKLQYYVEAAAYEYRAEFRETMEYERLCRISYCRETNSFAEQGEGLVFERTRSAEKQVKLGPAYVSEGQSEEDKRSDEKYYNKSLEGKRKRGAYALALPLLGQFDNKTYSRMLRALSQEIGLFVSTDDRGFLTDLYLSDYAAREDKSGGHDIVGLMNEFGIKVGQIQLHPKEFTEKYAEYESKYAAASVGEESRENMATINMDEDSSFWQGVEKGFLRTPDETKELAETKQAYFSFNLQESAGTRRLYNSLGFIVNTLDTKQLLLYDEIDAHLHPLLSRKIVQRFLHPKTNPRNVQLVYTTNDVSHFDIELLRRDQIYICQKDDATGAAEIGPLSDFDAAEIRERLPHLDLFAKDYYLQGHFYGVPDISEE